MGRFAHGVAGEPEHATAVDERDDDLAAGAVDRGHFAPDDADVEGAVKSHPIARELQVPILVRSAAAEPDRGDEVTALLRLQMMKRFDNRKPVAGDAIGELCRFLRRADFRELRVSRPCRFRCQLVGGTVLDLAIHGTQPPWTR